MTLCLEEQTFYTQPTPPIIPHLASMSGGWQKNDFREDLPATSVEILPQSKTAW